MEITNPDEAEALLSQNLACNVTVIVYKVEEFRAPISVMQCYNCQCFGHSAKTCRSKQKCLICGKNHSHKGCPSRGVVLICDPDPTTPTTATLRPSTYDPATLSTTPRPYPRPRPRPYDPEIAQLLFFAIHKIFIHSFCETFLKVGKIQYFLY